MREIACDESGYEGDKLVGGVTDVFAHAGVDLGLDAAAACVAELRRRIRSPAQEYKANHLLREKHRGALLWLLGDAGPLRGHAHVWLVDKTRHLVAVDAGAADDPVAVNDRLRRRRDPRLDLLVPAIALAVEHWSGRGDGPVTVVHDRQTSLGDDRLARLWKRCGDRLAGVRFVASRNDARVQVADFLAGVAFRVTSDARRGRADEEVLALLEPFVHPASVR